MGVRARGVSNIKTYSAIRGCGVHSNERHVHQFQIGTLELERSRRDRERQAAMERIKNIDARIIEIDLLIQKHQVALSGTSHDRPIVETEPKVRAKQRTLRY